MIEDWKHSTSLVYSIFQLLKTREKAIRSMVKMSELKVEKVYFDPEENLCLKACVLLRRKSGVATPDPTLSLTLLGTSKG